MERTILLVQTEAGADMYAFYDETTATVYGPVFSSFTDAERFGVWFRPCDPREYTSREFELLHMGFKLGRSLNHMLTTIRRRVPLFRIDDL